MVIPNIVSSLAVHHNSLNMLNIWQMTVYQLYDTFERQYIKQQLDIMGLHYAAWGGEYPFDEWCKSI